MLTSPTFKELLSVFTDHEVRYLVVGGYAVMRYAEPRFTKDLDLWISTDPENAERTFNALKAFGAPLKNLTPQDFCNAGSFYQMGMPPYRVDIMMSISGLYFESAWSRREMVDVAGIATPFIAREDLIRAKKSSGRPQDLLDVARLEKGFSE